MTLVPPAPLPVPVLHAVTTTEVASAPDFRTRARGVMRALGRRGALHLRAARLSALELYRLAEALAVLQADTGCWLVVVDRVDVAAAVGALGVQLTSQSLAVADARRVAPALLVGASAQSAAEARAVAVAGAAWVVVAQPNAEAGTSAAPPPFRQLASAAGVPVVVIGGVLPKDVAPLRRSGVHGVAVIRGIWDAENAERAVTDYLSAHDAEGGS